MKKIKLTALLLIPLACIGQETIPAAGGDASGSGGTVAYTVGQIVYTTNIGSNENITQGVQQPFEISETTGIKDETTMKIELVAYPNPTKENLTLKVQGDEYSTLSFELFDLQGRLIDSNKITSSSTLIKMEDLQKAAYILKVKDDKSSVKIFQIIKN